MLLILSIFISFGVSAKSEVQNKIENGAKQKVLNKDKSQQKNKWPGELCYAVYSGNWCCADGSEALGFVSITMFFCDFPALTLFAGDLINNDYDDACGP